MPANHSTASATIKSSALASGPTATTVNPCTGARSATSYRTSVAANRPGCRSSPGGRATGLGGLLPTGRPGPASLKADRFTTALGVQGRVGALPLPDKPSIAVLPFQNMSGDREQEYFADGMVEEIITALSRIRWLFVIARNSSFTYKGQAVDVKRIGRELGVRYVLEGSVRKGGNRV